MLRIVNYTLKELVPAPSLELTFYGIMGALLVRELVPDSGLSTNKLFDLLHPSRERSASRSASTSLRVRVAKQMMDVDARRAETGRQTQTIGMRRTFFIGEYVSGCLVTCNARRFYISTPRMRLFFWASFNIDRFHSFSGFGHSTFISNFIS